MNIFSVLPEDRGLLKNSNFGHLDEHTPQLLKDIYQIALNLPEHLHHHTLRKTINAHDHQTPISIDYRQFSSDTLEALGLAFRFLTQAYIWETPDQPANIVPPILAQQNYSFSKHQQRFPALTYTDYVLNNWRFKPNESCVMLESVTPIFTFTGTQDESWFIQIHIAVEATCGRALYAAIKCCENIKSAKPDKDIILECLAIIQQSIQQAAILLNRMTEQCKPAYYIDVLRHYLNGWERVKPNNATSGVNFDGVMLRGKIAHFSYKGPSGAQSSILPALDAALGIQHDIDELYQTLLTFQQYMPSEHVMLIQYFYCYNMAAFMEQSSDQELKNAWVETIEQLKLFRKAHIQLVQTFIYQPNINKGIAINTITGTGGTSVKDYLEDRYESTQV